MAAKRIVVVEDDQTMLQVVSRVLRAEGYEVSECNNGPKAVHEALATRPDLVVLDLMMPSPDPGVCEVFDGFTVLSWIKSTAELSHIPVIVLTAKPASEHKSETIRAGAVAYLQKPLDRDRLIAAVRIALDNGYEALPRKTQLGGLADLERLYPAPTAHDTNWRRVVDRPGD